MCDILGIVGSIRSNYKHIHLLKEMVLEAEDSSDLNVKILESIHMFSNTDIGVAHALLGAYKNGASIDFISITNIFSRNNLAIYGDKLQYETISDLDEIDTLDLDKVSYDEFLKKIDKADGIILGTPVYFGDRSSVANKFLQLTQKSHLLKNKAFGVVSSGAKRNGGQETANIYSLYEALMQKAVATGNGPQTAQYGGTIWAGDVGKATGDKFGLETSYGTGRQVSSLAKILSAEEDSFTEVLKVTVVVSMDTQEREFEKLVHGLFKKFSSDEIEINVLNLIDGNIYRCIACAVCPSPKHVEKFSDQEYPYHCIIQTKKDSMNVIQKELVQSDCIVIVGVNSDKNLIYRYQAFMERTRFIRHDDFELTNIPIIGMLINELGATNNPIFNVKVLTSFIRHNTCFLKPMEVIISNSKIVHQSDFAEYIPLLRKIKNGRSSSEPVAISYKATGYEDKQLDHTYKLRK